jgi:hypothetical protein
MNMPIGELNYVTSLEETLWGLVLIAITMAVHGFGMLVAIEAATRVGRWFAHREGAFGGVASIVLTSWIIVLVHLIEALVWAGFFLWKNALPSASISFYYVVMQYTTVGSEYSLPLHWRLLGGLVAMTGLLCFAWSTGVLFTLAQGFQHRQIAARERRRVESKR